MLGVERRSARQQLVEQNTEAVNVTACIEVQPTHLRLLRAHVSGRADELVVLRVDRFLRQLSLRRLGDAKVDDLGHRHAVVQRDEHV